MMKPDIINVIQVGEGLPKKIELLKKFNSEILKSSGIVFKWNEFKFEKKKFRTCAIQAEYLKIIFLSHVKNQVVCDWDVLFLKPPEFQERLKIGTRPESGPDSFFTYVPREFPNDSFVEYLNRLEKIGTMKLENGFSKPLYEEIFEGKGTDVNYPERRIIHLDLRYSSVLINGWKEKENGGC